MPNTPAMTTGMIDFITRSGFITPIDDTPTPDLAVPYAAPRSVAAETETKKNFVSGLRDGFIRCGRAVGGPGLAACAAAICRRGAARHALAKINATAAPINPKKGADAGQSSLLTMISRILRAEVAEGGRWSEEWMEQRVWLFSDAARV